MLRQVKIATTGPVARSTINTAVVLLVRLAAQAGLLLLLVRLLGVKNFGVYMGLAALAVMMGTIGTLGAHLVVLRDVSRDIEKRFNTLTYAIPTTLTVGAALLVIYCTLVYLLTTSNKQLSLIFSAIGVSELIITPLLQIICSDYQSRGKISRSQLLATAPSLLRLISALFILAASPDNPLTIFCIAHLSCNILVLCVAGISKVAIYPSFHHWRLPSFKELRDSSQFALLNLTSAGSSELDKTLSLRLLPPEVAGIYAASSRVVGAITLPISAMMLAALPRLFKTGSLLSHQNQRFLQWLILVSICYGVLIAIGLGLISPHLEKLFPAEFAGLAYAVSLFSLAIPGMTLRISGANVLLALGSASTRITLELMGTASLVLLAVILTGRFGINGIIFAIIFSEWLVGITTWLSVSKSRSKSNVSGRS